MRGEFVNLIEELTAQDVDKYLGSKGFQKTSENPLTYRKKGFSSYDLLIQREEGNWVLWEVKKEVKDSDLFNVGKDKAKELEVFGSFKQIKDQYFEM